jgi:hypothetical protein
MVVPLLLRRRVDTLDTSAERLQMRVRLVGVEGVYSYVALRCLVG